MNSMLIVYQDGTNIQSEEDWVTDEFLIESFFRWLDKTTNTCGADVTATASKSGWTVRIGNWYSSSAFTATGLIPDEIRLVVQDLIAPPPPPRKDCPIECAEDGYYVHTDPGFVWTEYSKRFKSKRAAKRFARRTKQQIDRAWYDD